MTGSMSSLWSLLFGLILYQMLGFAIINLSQGIQFEFHPSFSTTNLPNITIVSQDSWYTGQKPSFSEDGYILLNPDPNTVTTKEPSNLGQFIYKDPVRFKFNQDNKVVSFNTSFVFKIISAGAYGDAGNGMAFFISKFDKAPSYSDLGYLGLFNGSDGGSNFRFFAVEFDTHVTEGLEDISASHIGIDINSLISSNVTDTSPYSSSGFYPQLFLYNNYTFTAWIEYDSVTNLIQVWMTNSPSSRRPTQACLQLTYDLSSVFEETMYVGFTATNGAAYIAMEGHSIHAWSFYSDSPKISPSVNTSASPKVPSSHRHTFVIIVHIIALSILALSAASIFACIYLIRNRRRRRRENSRTETSSTIQLGSQRCTLPRYSYKELKRYSQGFSDQSKIGEGGFSSVYKATLADGSVVAVKRLKEGVRKEADFSAELNIISSIGHRNLLQLLGWCYERGEAMLVYKYMSKGSLDSYLFGEKQGTLGSETRLKILVGVASALEYLHGNLGECVLHRDVKAANVLLTEGFEPKLGDFGMARLISHDHYSAVTMTAVGTPGYIAPEVSYLGKFTDKADVYSFGVLTLEMAYGRPAMLRFSLQPDETRIVDYAWLLHQSDRLTEALDPSLLMDMMMPSQMEQWTSVLHVALTCCNPLPESRPTMRQVLQALKGEMDWLVQPPPKVKPVYPTSLNWPSAAASGSSILFSGSGGSSSAGAAK